jgi:hypothetical protein
MSATRIVVLGYIVRGPLGGLAWHHLQYCIGLANLGCDVLFLEDSDDYPSCYDPCRHSVSENPSYGLHFANETFSAIGLDEAWAYHDHHTGRWLGPAARSAPEFCANADIMLNVSGVNPARPWLGDIPVRVFIDTDPVFTQIRSLTEPDFRALIDWHTAHFTFGELVAAGRSRVPDDGIAWKATRQPVALDCWQYGVGPDHAPFTTVMQWQSYRGRAFAGVTYGMKSESFGNVMDLPQSSPVGLEIALGGEEAPRDRLRAHGWRITDPLSVTRTIDSYQQYLRDSMGEFSVAKEGYVTGRSGWFSERSAAYLASGRPVVTQDTGFGELFEVGRGLLAYRTAEEALDALVNVAGDYAKHCVAAREVARSHFNADIVLENLLSEL